LIINKLNFYQTRSIPKQISIKNQSSVFQIYPNPVVGNMYIETNTTAIPITKINIFSMDGRVWRQQRFTDFVTSYNIDLSHLPEGIYYAQINSNQSVYTHKFLKMN